MCSVILAIGGCEQHAEATKSQQQSAKTQVVSTSTILEPTLATNFNKAIATASPLRLDPPTVDFGKIQRGAPAEATVRLINTTNEPLQLKQAKTSCGCTVAEVSKEPFGPGESTEVTVRLKSRNKAGSKPTKTVRFILEGDYEPVLLSVTAEIADFISLEPEQLDRPLVQNQLVKIRSADGKAFRILDVTPRIVSSILSPKASPSHELVISADLWKQQGLPDTLIFELDHPETNRVDLRILRPKKKSTSASTRQSSTIPKPKIVKRTPAKPVLQTYPRRMSIGHLSPGSVFVREILLRGVSEDRDFAPQIVCDSQLLIVELADWQATSDGIQLKVRLIPVPDKRGRVESLLTVDYGYGRGYTEIHGRVRPDESADAQNKSNGNESNRSQEKGK